MLRAILETIILGVVQGIAEFAPISSSAHLILVPWLFRWETSVLNGLAFDVSLHLGTLAAVFIYFRHDLWRLLKAWLASIVQFRINPDPDRRLAWFLIVGTIPAAIVGFTLEDVVDATFHADKGADATGIMLAVAAMLVIFGLIMLFVDSVARHTRPLENMRLVDSIVVGLAQTLALFPGVSRSGATLTAGLGLGFRREVAARYAFLLSVPITLGAGLKGFVDLVQGWQSGVLGSQEMLLVLIGMAAAGIAGYLCIAFLLRYLRTRSVMIFVIYRCVLAAIVVVAALTRA